MSSQWKQFERNVAAITGGTRYHYNSGGRVDTEGPEYITQCKERKSLSLEQITQLVEEIETIADNKGKKGLLAVKVRRGSGKSSPILIIQTALQWQSEQIKRGTL